MSPLLLSPIEIALGLVAAALVGGIVGYLLRTWTEHRRLARSDPRAAPRPAADDPGSRRLQPERPPVRRSTRWVEEGGREAVEARAGAEGGPSLSEEWSGPLLTGPDDRWNGSVRGGRATVLLVDDRMELCAVHSAYLRQHGYSVLTAGDGEAALQLVRQHHPGVVVLDHSLPRRTGIEVTREMRSDPDTAGIPVILLTAHSYGAIGMAAQQAGVSLFLPKPADPSRVLREVERQLRESHPPS